MLRIDVTLPLGFTKNDIENKIESVFPVGREDIRGAELLKLTLNTADKGNICYRAAIGVTFDSELEEKFSKRKKVCSPVPSLEFSYGAYRAPELRPVVVGAGPCGLFAALTLAEVGARPIVLERGGCIDDRDKKVNAFLHGGELDPECNVQFGEGGAGTYSDGKLKAGSLNKYKYKILKEFIEAGATHDILYSSTAHLGTDKLGSIVKNLRKKITDNGGEFIFDAKMTDIVTEDGALCGIVYTKGGESRTIPCREAILAIGHSARDTHGMLYARGIKMIARGFGIGMRVEHPREYINELVYGKNHDSRLESASYHLVTHLKSGRSVYSFCMCPGGTVVPAASESGSVVTNGMSSFARDAQNSNSALLVSVTPEDFGVDHPLAGFELQRRIEQSAYALTEEHGRFVAPSFTVGELVHGTSHGGSITVTPSYPLGTAHVDPDHYLPSYIKESLRESFSDFDAWMGGFYLPEATLTGPETRTTSPVRILRGELSRECISLRGLYPSGEGAGYAGGIVTSAYDGVLSALSLLEKYKK